MNIESVQLKANNKVGFDASVGFHESSMTAPLTLLAGFVAANRNYPVERPIPLVAGDIISVSRNWFKMDVMGGNPLQGDVMQTLNGIPFSQEQSYYGFAILMTSNTNIEPFLLVGHLKHVLLLMYVKITLSVKSLLLILFIISKCFINYINKTN